MSNAKSGAVPSVKPQYTCVTNPDCPGHHASKHDVCDQPDSPEVLALHIAFAKLELLELQAGRRTLLECPGIENVARAIQQERARREREHG